MNQSPAVARGFTSFFVSQKGANKKMRAQVVALVLVSLKAVATKAG